MAVHPQAKKVVYPRIHNVPETTNLVLHRQATKPIMAPITDINSLLMVFLLAPKLDLRIPLMDSLHMEEVIIKALPLQVSRVVPLRQVHISKGRPTEDNSIQDNSRLMVAISNTHLVAAAMVTRLGCIIVGELRTC